MFGGLSPYLRRGARFSFIRIILQTRARLYLCTNTNCKSKNAERTDVTANAANPPNIPEKAIGRKLNATITA